MALALTLLLVHLLPLTLAQEVVTQDVADCSCGFYDPDTALVFTDTSIVYFNETDVLPDDLIPEAFEHRYDRGWNAIYRQGAAIENIEIVNDTSARNLQTLGLYCDPADDSGLVNGASIKTSRQDIFFGSFRTSMRVPRQWLKGSAISMLLHHNQTESWNIDVMNTDNSSWAWVSMLAEGQFSDLWLGANFTDLIDAGNNMWYYVEYRVDWTRDSLDYYINGTLMQSYTKEINGTLPSTPSKLQWQHWSLGNRYNTQGPPGQRSEANIAWTRLFFNSSLTTDEERKAFDDRCTSTAACRMDDNTLRGSSNYSSEALKPWKQYHPKWSIPWIPFAIDIAFLALATIFTTKTLWRRLTWAKVYALLGIKKSKSSPVAIPAPATSDSGSETKVRRTSTKDSSEDSDSTGLPRDSSYTSFTTPPVYSGFHTPAPDYQSPRASHHHSRNNSALDLVITPIPRSESVGSGLYMSSGVTNSAVFRSPLPGSGSKFDTAVSTSEMDTGAIPGLSGPQITLSGAGLPTVVELQSGVQAATATDSRILETAAEGKKAEVKLATTEGEDVVVKVLPANQLPKQQRVDYLAGFIAMSAVLVTMNHFSLTFWAAVIEPSVRPHYQSEIWARKTIGAYFLDPLWIGPFLMISTRFLTSNYLRTGKLDNMAQKIVARPFRLLVPVASIATLEYFLMDAGALHWLEYLPSITWSSWPFTSIVANPGVFVSEIIELAYLIPNAAPMITYNYCTGVLWTIPVQLQGAWQTLLALIMVRECKTPWKRFSFYGICIAQHWYGLSWGSYYYAGVLLADLDITFKYKTWLHARPLAYYPLLISMIVIALGGFTIDLVTQWTGVNYAEYEYGWHPDTASALTISQSGNSVYPDYFIPRLNALLATVSMQVVVEICPTLQKVLSIKPLQWLFPHIFTIYLIHGFIFWSVGSWAMVSIFSYGCPYWLCVLLVFIICYGTLLGSLPLLTPPIEMLGKKLTLSIWEHASQEPAPKRPTTWPFGPELLQRGGQGTGRSVNGLTSIEEEKGNPFADPDEKKKKDGPFSSSDETKGKAAASARTEEV